MKKSYKIVALMLLVSTLFLICAVGVSAGVGSNVVQRMDCTIYYKDESGNTVAAPTTFTIKLNEPSTFSTPYPSPSVEGYALKNEEDANVSYSMMEKYYPSSNYVVVGTATYTVVYVRIYTHTVYYMYGVNTRPAAETVSKTGKPGTAYSFTSPTVSGHGPSQSTVTGTILSTNTSTTVYYYPYTYTVSYNAMGGTGAPSSQTKTYGVPLTLSSTVPTKSGYTFEGWATSRGSTVVAFGVGGTYTGKDDIEFVEYTMDNENIYVHVDRLSRFAFVNAKDKGLSAGAVTGIVIAGIAVVAVLFFLFFLLKRRKKEEEEKKTESEARAEK